LKVGSIRLFAAVMLHPKRENYRDENLKVKLKIQSTNFVNLWLRNENRKKR
jgi:hypothetical protein